MATMMQRTTVALRLVTQALVLAFIALVLVVVACTGAQSSSMQQTVAQQISAHQTTLIEATAVEGTAVERPPLCIPGRDTTRVESNAVSPSAAALHYCPTGISVRTAAHLGNDSQASQLSGRIPAALTHLDLGIVRT